MENTTKEMENLTFNTIAKNTKQSLNKPKFSLNYALSDETIKQDKILVKIQELSHNLNDESLRDITTFFIMKLKNKEFEEIYKLTTKQYLKKLR